MNGNKPSGLVGLVGQVGLFKKLIFFMMIVIFMSDHKKNLALSSLTVRELSSVCY